MKIVPPTINISFSNNDPSCHIGSRSTLLPLLLITWLKAAAAAATVPVPCDPSRTINLSGIIAPHSTAYCELFNECVQAKMQRQTDVTAAADPLNDDSARTHRLIVSEALTTT